MTKLSIIIPAWNEANRIGESLEKVGEYLAMNEFGKVEVMVVVADSPDGTLAIVQSKSDIFDDFKIIDAGPRVGKGRDVRMCMKKAVGDYKLFMDADLATPLHHLKTVYRLMQQHIDVIIGVRDLPTTHHGLRKLLSNTGNSLIRLVLSMDIQDTQCGFKAFRGPVADDLFSHQTITGWGFDIELLVLAQQRDYSIWTIPIPDWQDVEGGSFDDVVINGSFSTLKDLLKIKWNLLRSIYGKEKGQEVLLQEF